MDPFDQACPHCASSFRVRRPEIIGRNVRCPRCREIFHVAQPSAAESGLNIERWTQQAGGSGHGSGTALLQEAESERNPGSSACSVFGSGELEGPGMLHDSHNSNVLGGPETSTWEPATENQAFGADDGDHTIAYVEEDASLPEALPEFDASVDSPSNEDLAPAAESNEFAGESADVADNSTAQYQGQDTELPEPEESNEYEQSDDDQSEHEQAEEPVRTRGATTRRAPARNQTVQIMIGAALAVFVVIGLVIVGTSSSASGVRSRSSNRGRTIERRNPREFSDFARDAERKGWR